MKLQHKMKYIMGSSIALLTFIGSWAASTPTAHAATVWGLTGLDITSRAGWGADETRRLRSRPEYKTAIEKAAADAAAQTDEDGTEEKPSNYEIALNYVLNGFASDFAIQRVWKSEGGKVLYWPLQIVAKKTKILIHHTASDPGKVVSVSDEKQYIQGVYKYHAFTRGRGDIGYNFVIMPSGRIYEGRKGGVGVVAAHATWNNTPSIGISLVGNFVDAEPTQAQIDALAKLTTSLSAKYTIDPLESTVYFRKSTSWPYIEVTNHQRIAGHTDAGWTACPGAKLYELLPALRSEVSRRLAGQAPQSITVPKIILPLGGSSAPTPAGGLMPHTAREDYCLTNACNVSTANVQRMDEAPALSTLSTLQRAPVRVLLYDATIDHDSRAVSCQGNCVLQYPGGKRRVKSAIISKEGTGFSIRRPGGIVHKEKAAFSAGKEGALTIVNYNRKTANGVGLNVFRESLLFASGPLKKIGGEVSTGQHVINVLSQDHYMQGIAEATDNQSQTKADVLALLSKQYMLFYTSPAATHPSIPAGAVYNTIDDPRLFQKYMGKGRESISQKRPRALQNTRNTIVTFNNTIPLLPYFHCSAGFTRAAKEKRGWTDTPYLASVEDAAGSCGNGTFEGHGVGLSGKGASAMADAGRSMEEIVGYYYPGVKVQPVK